MRLPSRIIALLMAFQAAAAWAVPTGVLCLSADGHAALESFNSACCHPTEHPGETEPAHALTSSVEERCGPCVDIPLVQPAPALKSGEHHGLEAPPTVAVLPASIASAPLPPDAARRLTTSLPPTPTALRALRTVVLTC